MTKEEVRVQLEQAKKDLAELQNMAPVTDPMFNDIVKLRVQKMSFLNKRINFLNSLLKETK